MSVEQVTLLLGLFAGLLGAPLIQAVKNAFGWKDKVAFTAAGIVSLLLAILVLVGQGVFGNLTWEMITVPYVINLLTEVMVIATAIYKYLMAQKVQ